MKIKILFLVFYIIPLLAFTQTLDWAKRIGGLKTEAAYGIVIDKAGNIYTTGFFGGTVDFDPGAGVSNLSALSDENIFIQKLDANGDFVWAKSMLGTLESRAYIMALDSAGDVYVTGYFKGTVDFDPNAGTTNITSNGENDLFVLKLSSTGNLVWVKAMGGTDVEIALGISVDAMGNVFTSGGFSDTVDFDPGVGVSNLISKGSTDIFIQKLNLIHAGMDQRKAHVIAREVASKLKIIKPIAVHHNLILGLKKPSIWPIEDKSQIREIWSEMKMSKSKPDSAVFIEDSEDEIKRKINKAFCPEGEIEFNPILDWTKNLIFVNNQGRIIIHREEKYGGDVSYEKYEDLEKDFKDKKLYPQDLKIFVANWLIEFLEPIRKHFSQGEAKEMKDELEEII